MNKLQKIDFNQKPVTFKGKSGTAYTVLEKVSAGRWDQFEDERLAITFGKPADNVYDGLYEIYEQLQTGAPKLADASVKTFNLMSSIKDIEAKKSPIRRMAALTCAKEDETVGELSEEEILKKVDDFECIDMDDFFFLILHFMPHFQKSYEQFLELEKSLNLMKNRKT